MPIVNLESKIVSASQVQTASVGMSVSASMAGAFCRAVIDLEARAKAIHTKNPPIGEQQACVLSCVINSACWVEGFINELYCDCADAPHMIWINDLKGHVPDDSFSKLGYAWSNGFLDRSQLFDKVDLLLTTFGKPKLERKRNSPLPPAFTMNLLIWLRNTLVHAEPSRGVNFTTDGVPTHQELREALTGQFPFGHANNALPFLPYQVLSLECASWAIDTAKAFVDHVSDRIGIPRRFDAQFKDRK